MTGHLAYAAARAHIDDLHREAAAERLAAVARDRPRRRILFSWHRDRVDGRLARDPNAESPSRPVAGLPTVARH
jgi:hypothetical protein